MRPPALRLAVVAGAVLLAGAPAAAAPGDLALVSLGSAGAQGTTPAEAAAVSADGRHVAFTSASALAGVPTGGLVQLYVRDRVAGTTTLASASAAGAAANAAVDAEDVGNAQFAVSGDGRYVVFAGAATNLSPLDGDAGRDVYRKDLETGAVELISVATGGAKANAPVAGDPDISYDGSRVAFGTGAATNLAGPDANAAGSDVVVRDVVAGTTTLAAVNPAGTQADGTTERPSISADGRVVAFEAPAGTTNLAPNDTGGANDVYVRDLVAGTTTAASDPTVPTGSGFPDISGDGRHVVFESGHKYDPVNDLSAGNDAYRRDRGTGAITLVSARDGLDAGGGADGLRPAITADGSRVTFTSTSTDLTPDANAAVRDVFVRDVDARTTRLASVRADGATQGSTDAERSAAAANGGLVAFTTDDAGAVARLVPADVNAQRDALAKELAPSDAAGPTLTLTGPADGAVQRQGLVVVSGTVGDPSAVVALTVNGAPVAVAAGGAFSTGVPAPVGPTAITVRALDGAGNATVVTRTVTRTAPPVVARPVPRLALLRVGLSRGRPVVRLRLGTTSRVRFLVLRRAARPGAPRRAVLVRVGRPVVRGLRAGVRSVRLPGPRLRPGRYVVRVQVIAPRGVPRREGRLLVRAPRDARRTPG